jgi:hypothetical protein
MTGASPTFQFDNVSESLRAELEKFTSKKQAEPVTVSQRSRGAAHANYSKLFSGISATARAFASEIEATLNPSITYGQQSYPSAQVSAFGKVNTGAMIEASQELLSFMSLKNGWDGPGSVAPSKFAISDAYSFLHRLRINNEIPEPTVYADGEVGWYWVKGNDVVSVVFDGNGRYAFYGVVDGKSVRSPSKEYGNAIPEELYSALGSI